MHDDVIPPPPASSLSSLILETPHGIKTTANASVADGRNPMPVGEEEATNRMRRRCESEMCRAKMGGKRQSTDQESTSGGRTRAGEADATESKAEDARKNRRCAERRREAKRQSTEDSIRLLVDTRAKNHHHRDESLCWKHIRRAERESKGGFIGR